MNNIFISEMECTISTLETERKSPFVLKNNAIREYNLITKGTMTSKEFKNMFYIAGHQNLKITLNPQKDMAIDGYNYNNFGGTTTSYHIKGSLETFRTQEHIMLDYEKDLGMLRKNWSLQSFLSIERDLLNIQFMEKTSFILNKLYSRRWEDIEKRVTSERVMQNFFIIIKIKNLNPNIRDHLLNIYYQIKNYEDLIYEKEEIYDCICEENTSPSCNVIDYSSDDESIDSDLEYQIQKVRLKEGWNYYSNYLIPLSGNKLNNYIPKDPNLDGAIFENTFVSPPIKSKYYLNFGWYPNCKINSIFTAFKIKVRNNHTIVMNGNPPENDEVELNSGWNMIGYPYKKSSNLKDFLHEDEISFFKNGDLIKVLKYNLCLKYTNDWAQNFILRKNKVLHIKLNGFHRKFKIKFPAVEKEYPPDLFTQTIDLNIGKNIYGNNLIPYTGIRLNDYIPSPNKLLWGANVQNPYLNPPISSTYYKDFGWYPNSKIPNIFIGLIITVKCPMQISYKGYKPTESEVRVHSGWNLLGYPYNLGMNITNYFMEDDIFLQDGDFIYIQQDKTFQAVPFYPKLNHLYPNLELNKNMGLKVYLKGEREGKIKYELPQLVKFCDKIKKKYYKIDDNLHMIVRKINKIKIKKIVIKIKNIDGVSEYLFTIINRMEKFYEKNQYFVTEFVGNNSLLLA